MPAPVTGSFTLAQIWLYQKQEKPSRWDCDGKEVTMQTARKLDACNCGVHSETSCSGCGIPVCRNCGHQEITTNDPGNIIVTYYCSACKADPKKNTWGNLYWDSLAALYT